MHLLRLWRLDRTTPRSEAAPAPRVRLYVGAWVGAALGLVLLLADLRPSLLDGPLELVALIAAVVIADAVSVSIQHARSTELVTVVDVAVALTILSVPPAAAIVVVFAGVFLNDALIGRRARLKALFNASQHAVAAGLGASVLVLVPLAQRTGPFTARLLAMSAVALLVYFVVHGLAMIGLFATIGQRQSLREFFARAPFLGVTVLGNGVAGLLAYGVLQTNPLLLPLLVSPIVAMQLAYRNTARSDYLLSEVRIERDRFERVVTGASEGIVLLDADGVVLMWNPAMEAITGREAEDALGRRAEDVLAGEDGNGIAVDPSMPIHRDESGVYELTLTSVSGETEPPIVQMSHTVLSDHGTVTGDVVVVRDLSRERAARSLKEDFVSRVSHELRTPLTPIRGYAQVLLESGDRVDAEKRQVVLERIVERVGHLERLIEDLLLVSRISSGDVGDVDEVTLAAFEALPLVSRLVEWSERDNADRLFSVDAPPVLPLAWGDAFRVGQIVTNLLSNACKYSPKGRPVEVRLEHTQGRVRIAVTDHGAGIARDQLETVFERFQRLDDPQRMKTGGIGLGLYISRHLAERMGGSLTVTSRLGAGSTFTLELPTAADETAPGAGVSSVDVRPGTVHRRPTGMAMVAG